MADFLSKAERSRRMSLVRSFGNASTELRLAKELRRSGITGWRRHQNLPGRPDFSFRGRKLAIFVDGDFWHGNSRRKMPMSNTEFWAAKIARNRARDRKVDKELAAKGWKVLRIWESELRQRPGDAINKIRRHLTKGGDPF